MKTGNLRRTHIQTTCFKLRQCFSACGWVTLRDITVESLDAHLAASTLSMAQRFRLVEAIKTFLRRQQEVGHNVNPGLLAFRVVKPPAAKIHHPWTVAEDEQWATYLMTWMELIAGADRHLPWLDRVRALAPDIHFRQRMTLILPYLLGSRYLYRTTEMCELNVEHWNTKTKQLTLPFALAKADGKVSEIDNETAWLLDLYTLGRGLDEPLMQNLLGRRSDPQYLGPVTKEHLVLAGLPDKLPYDVKYTRSTFMYRHPELFAPTNGFDTRNRIEQIKALSGHTEDSESMKLYV